MRLCGYRRMNAAANTDLQELRSPLRESFFSATKKPPIGGFIFRRSPRASHACKSRGSPLAGCGAVSLRSVTPRSELRSLHSACEAPTRYCDRYHTSPRFLLTLKLPPPGDEPGPALLADPLSTYPTRFVGGRFARFVNYSSWVGRWFNARFTSNDGDLRCGKRRRQFRFNRS